MQNENYSTNKPFKSAVPCDPGYFCPPGSITQQPCEFGSYTNETSQSGCKICEIGFYCSGTSIEVCKPSQTSALCNFLIVLM